MSAQRVRVDKGGAVIREDRELLAELARLNSDVTPFAMRIIDGSITPAEQYEFADRVVDWAARSTSGLMVLRM